MILESCNSGWNPTVHTLYLFGFRLVTLSVKACFIYIYVTKTNQETTLVTMCLNIILQGMNPCTLKAGGTLETILFTDEEAGPQR